MAAVRIRGQLKQQYGIVAPEDWAEACVEWIQQDHQADILHERQLFDLVYEQWLLADLRELGAASLPPGLAQQQTATLSGVHCLQVDSIMDASQSYYGQLQKVKGTENANVNVTATQHTQPAWETKSSRLLTLRMTDGVQNIQGMEYRPIQALSTQLSPGVKVQIQGPVLCRVGVLMLQASNLQVLGGEVEGLVAHNTQETLLTNSLNAKEEVMQTRGKLEEKKVFNNNEGENPRQRPNMTDPNPRGHVVKQEYQAPGSNREYRQDRSQIGGSSTNMVKEERPGTQNVTQGHYSRNTGYAQGMKSENVANADPFDDFPDDAILEAMPMDTMPPLGPVSTNARNPSSSSWKATSTEQQTEMDEDHIAAMMEDIPDEFLDVPEPVANFSATGISRKKLSHKPAQEVSSASAILSVRDSDVFFTATELRKTNSNVGLLPSSGASNNQTVNKNSELTKSCRLSVKKEPLVQTCTRSISVTSVESLHTKTEQDSSQTSSHRHSVIQRHSLQRENFPRNMDYPSEKTSSKPAAKRIKTEKEHKESKTLMLGAKVGDQIMQMATSISKDSVPSSSVSVPNPKKLGLYSSPFTYLCLLRDTHPVKPSFFRVKAYISTLLGKLEYKSGYWSVAAKINDGSASMDVDLGDEMLSVLIGFSAKECLEMKEKIRTNSALKTKIMQGIKGCQQSLIQLSCILELELSPFRARPYVLRHLAITEGDLDALAKRQ